MKYIKISNNIEDLNNIISQLNLINIYRTLCPTTIECTFFSSAWNIHQNRPHIIKQVLYQVCCMNNGIKLEIHNRKIYEESPNIWKLNNTLLKKKYKRKLESIVNRMNIKTQNIKRNIRGGTKAILRGKCNNCVRKKGLKSILSTLILRN